MANVSITVSNIIAEIAQLGADVVLDEAELKAGGLVKVGQIGSIAGEPLFIYLSTNSSAT